MEFKSKINFGYVGRYNEMKDLDTLFHSFRIASINNFDFHLHCFGQDMTNENLKLMELIYLNSLEKKISLYGNIDNKDHIYDSFEVLVLSSISEGFPNVVLEAMIRGKYCICTNVGELPFILEKFGFLVNVRSSSSIYYAIVFVYKFSHILFSRQYKSKLNKYVLNNYSLSNNVLRFVNIYDKVLQRN